MAGWICSAILFLACIALYREITKARKATTALYQDINAKNIVMERASQTLEISKKATIDLTEMVDTLQKTLDFQQTQYDKLANQKKSSEVRTGLIVEQISPFLADYPRPSATARFIGEPIDFVHFDDDKITFVEVKSGKSQLSKKQRNIRDLIKEGKVDFMIFRIEGNDDGPDQV